jgi:hypothetical protein
LVIEEPTLAGCFAFVLFLGVELETGAAGVVVVGVAAAPAAPAAAAPSEITCAGGAFAEPTPARPISTPTPIASSSTPTPAISARLLLRPKDGVEGIIGGVG